MTWEYRIGRKTCRSIFSGSLSESFGVIELYYDSEGNPSSYAYDILPYGESRTELEYDLQRMLEASRKPVIDLDNFPNELP